MATTLTEAPPRSPGGQAEGAVLVRALHADAPLAPGARFSLRGLDTVTLGRGEAHHEAHDAAARALRLDVADARMSTRHARLTRVLGAWVLEDLGAKNGVRRGGELVTRAELADGDVLELGRTFFVFRAAQPAAPAMAGAPAGLATWNGALALRFDELRRVAPTRVSVVLGGESGTGKELAARAVHALSGRAGAFVAVNCGALPEALVEAELFGHRRGAFSGAREERPGLVRAAHGGTLFLDEVGDLPLGAQPALLRVLQEQQVHPLGATAPVPVDVRVVCATHRDLAEASRRGLFRDDLRARLAGFELVLPPLAQRREDLGLLVAALLRKLTPGRAGDVRLTPEAARALFLAPWRLNVRELEKALEAALALADGEAIEVQHLPGPLAAPPGRGALAPAPLSGGDEARRAELEGLLAAHGGNVSAVARAMGKARMQVQRWLARYGLDPRAFRR